MYKRCKQCQKRGFRFLKILQIKTHSRFFYPIIELIPLNVEILCYKCVDQLSRIYQQQLILSQYVTFSFDFYSVSSSRINQQEDSSSSESDYMPGNTIKPKKKIKRGSITRIKKKKQRKKHENERGTKKKQRKKKNDQDQEKRNRIKKKRKTRKRTRKWKGKEKGKEKEKKNEKEKERNKLKDQKKNNTNKLPIIQTKKKKKNKLKDKELILKTEITKKELLLKKKIQDPNPIETEQNNFFLENETLKQEFQIQKIGNLNFTASSNFGEYNESPSNNFALINNNSFNQIYPNQFNEQELDVNQFKEQKQTQEQSQLQFLLKEKEKEKEQVQDQQQEQIPFFEQINWGADQNFDLDFSMSLDNNLNFGLQPQTEFSELNLLNTKGENMIKFSNLTQNIFSEQDEKKQMKKQDQLQLQPQVSQSKPEQRLQQPKTVRLRQIRQQFQPEKQSQNGNF
ncbi:hypothetical protein M0812_28205 [Anaeramoeba flamelloides]|uniref:ZAD domain-containing protein n=1 Tax=Anaeramoeba flamelloides TaxID=1746091 RepID=A0AAV7Y8C0_9EUKA|nr:hypothetical protein M0812_28205 [Anaeramoeba flamelloides]